VLEPFGRTKLKHLITIILLLASFEIKAEGKINISITPQKDKEGSLIFYKQGDKFLFKIKSDTLFYKDKEIAKCKDKVCPLEKKPKDHQTEVWWWSSIQYADYMIALDLYISDFFDSNESDMEGSSIKGGPDSVEVLFQGEKLKGPEDAAQYSSPELDFDILNKRGQRFLKSDQEFQDYFYKVRDCVFKDGIKCKILTESEDWWSVKYKYEGLILKAMNNPDKYITYNFNKGPAIYDHQLKMSCYFTRKNEKKKWEMKCNQSGIENYRQHDLDLVF